MHTDTHVHIHTYTYTFWAFPAAAEPTHSLAVAAVPMRLRVGLLKIRRAAAIKKYYHIFVSVTSQKKLTTP